jgi:hypothetical protein
MTFSTPPITLTVFNSSTGIPSSSAVTLEAIHAQQLWLQEMYQQYEREARLADLRTLLDFEDDTRPRITTETHLNVAYIPFQGAKTGQTDDLT